MISRNTLAYDIKSIESACLRQALGGIAAMDSYMMEKAVVNIVKRGLTHREVAEIIKKAMKKYNVSYH